MSSLSIWFMFDNHTFAKVKARTRGALIEEVKALFREDSCGSIFVRDDSQATIATLTLHSHQLDPGNFRYGVRDSELEIWANLIMAELLFRSMMVA